MDRVVQQISNLVLNVYLLVAGVIIQSEWHIYGDV